MANIRLKELLEVNVDPKLVARSKESGKLVYFKTPQAKDAAMKAGTHEDPKAKKGGQPKADVKPNDMFGGDYAKDRGGEAKPDGGFGWGPENDRTPITQLPKKASELTNDHSSLVMDVLNKELGIDGLADTDDNTGAIRYTASAGDEPTYTLYFGANDDYDKPDEFRVTLESTYGNDPANLEGKHDKSFKSSKDAITYMTALGKKYKKEMQMDDSKTSSKLTSMLPKGDSGTPQKMTNRDTQIEKLYNKKEAADNEWDYQNRQYSQAIRNNDNPAVKKKMENEWDKIDIELQQKSNAIQKQINNLEPSTIAFGKKTQKAVSDWFDTNKIPYELKAGSDNNTPELQFDSKDLPKDKIKELVKLAKHVQKEEGIGIDGDLDSTLYIK
jgi:hypothetical protein